MNSQGRFPSLHGVHILRVGRTLVSRKLTLFSKMNELDQFEMKYLAQEYNVLLGSAEWTGTTRIVAGSGSETPILR